MNEWAYVHIEPLLVVEELLSEVPPIDYRFVCYHSKVKWMYVRIQENNIIYMNLYNLQWEQLYAQYDHLNYYKPLPKPDALNEMVSVAEILAKGADLVRVDLYNIEGKIFFGELTNYPNGGMAPFTPSKWDTIFGAYYYEDTIII